ncbi:hypothetical protein HDU88_006776 [Geranomyces variabilis]|nr:hypothetical protein HDU88_006776 [Geranomyces variabilis]
MHRLRKNESNQFLSIDIQQDLTGYGLTRVEVTGGGSHGCYRWYNALIRAESGNLTVQDWEVTGAANSAGPVVQLLNTYTEGLEGPKIAAFWVSGVTMKNVFISGTNLGPSCFIFQAGFVRLENVTIDSCWNLGAISSFNRESQTALIRLMQNTSASIDGLHLTNNSVTLGIDSFSPWNSLEIVNSYINGNKFSRCLETSANTAVAFTNVTISSNDCYWQLPSNTTTSFEDSRFENNTISAVVPYFDFSESTYRFKNTKLTANRFPFGSVFSLKEQSVLILDEVEISSTYALQSLLITDISSTVEITSTVFRHNTADYRDMLALNYRGNISSSDLLFAGNQCNRGNLIKVASGTKMSTHNSNFVANTGTIFIDSGGTLAASDSTFAKNGPRSAVASSGDLELSNCTFVNNSGTNGGAIRHVPLQFGMLVIKDSRFVANNGSEDGGAIYVDSDSFNPLSFRNVTFLNNAAKRGGAVFQLQSEWATVGADPAALLHLSGNTAAWQGNDFATGLAALNFSNNTSLSTLSGAYLPDIAVRALDAYGNNYRSPRDSLLKMTLSVSGATLIGSTSAYMLTGEAKFSQLRLFARAGNITVTVKPLPGLYDPQRYHSSLQVITLPCDLPGMEETFTDASQYPGCTQSVCTEGCLSDYGFCRDNFCFCTASKHEGINCGLVKGSADTLSMTLPSSWAPSAANRDALLATIKESLNGAATPEFRSFESTMANDTANLARRAAYAATVFTFSLVYANGQHVESTALKSYGQQIVTALSTNAGVNVTLSAIASPKQVVDSKDAISIVFMVLAALSMVISLVFGVFLIIYRQRKAVKASSVFFSQQILLGVAMGYVLVFLYIGEPTNSSCLWEVWIGGLAFSLAIGNLIGKNWRVFTIFRTTGRAKAVKDQDVLVLVVFIVIIEIIIDAIWTTLAPLKPLLHENDSGRFFVCDSTAPSNMTMTSVALVYKLSLLLTACALAFLMRKVDVQYSESKSIAICTYTMLLSAVIILPMVFLPQTTVTAAFYFKSAGVLISGLVTTFALFWPKFWVTVLSDIGTRSSSKSGRRRDSRYSRRKPSRVSEGSSSISSAQDAATFSSTVPPTAEDTATVQTPMDCFLFERKGLAGRLQPSQIFLDIQTNIIFIRENAKQGILPAQGRSIRIEHITQCIWDLTEKSLLLQAGDNSVHITFASMRPLQAYVLEVQARSAKAGGTGTLTAQARPTSFILLPANFPFQ